jgi:hypothetical protein
MAELLCTHLKRDAIPLMSVFFSIALIPIPADYIGWALQYAFMKGCISIAKLILQHRNNISADKLTSTMKTMNRKKEEEDDADDKW